MFRKFQLVIFNPGFHYLKNREIKSFNLTFHYPEIRSYPLKSDATKLTHRHRLVFVKWPCTENSKLAIAR